MTDSRPVIVALPLDQETEDILAAARQLGLRIERPILVVHALHPRRLEGEEGLATRVGEVRTQIEPRLQGLRDAGLEVRVEVAVGHPAELVLETAQRRRAELIVSGGGAPATVRRWLVGSVAEALVRRASVPVWVVRGAPPVGEPVLCPVDLSPLSKLGLASAIRMARAFDSPLRVMTVVAATDEPDKSTDEDEGSPHERVERLLGAHDHAGLDVSVVAVSGVPAEQIVKATDDVGLLVVGSRGFDPLIPEWLGPVTTRALRHSHCNTLTIREVDVDLGRREHAISVLAADYRAAKALLDDDRAEEALALIQSAAERAPANATIQETLAIALERVGHDEARGRREIAATIRRRITSDQSG